MYLLFDIGVTKMRLGISKDGKTILQTKVIPTPQSFDQAITAFGSVSRQLLNGQKPGLVAGGLKGPLDKTKSFPTNTPDLPDWANKPFKQRLEQELNTKVLLENDAALAGLGEAVFGAGTGKNIVAYITVSTGVGGVRIVNKQIDQNFLGFEIGHQTVDLNNRFACGCGGVGHLEAQIGGASIEKRYQKKAQDIVDPVFWKGIAKILAYGLNNVMVHWSPEIVILGGSLIKSIPLDDVKSNLENILTIFPQIPQVVKSKLEDVGGLYGALELINQA